MTDERSDRDSPAGGDVDKRAYPDEPAGPFPAPPATVVDRSGREIEIRCLDRSDPDEQAADLAALVDMYDRFDPADRAQGIPPIGRDRVEEWLSSLVGSDAVNVLAWHGDYVAGHATLVPDGTGAYELAIFVHQDYQRAGIGSRLIRHLLGAGASPGTDRVWLTVERWNGAAIALYESVGFETIRDDRFEIEMAIRLD